MVKDILSWALLLVEVWDHFESISTTRDPQIGSFDKKYPQLDPAFGVPCHDHRPSVDPKAWFVST